MKPTTLPAAGTQVSEHPRDTAGGTRPEESRKEDRQERGSRKEECRKGGHRPSVSGPIGSPPAADWTGQDGVGGASAVGGALVDPQAGLVVSRDVWPWESLADSRLGARHPCPRAVKAPAEAGVAAVSTGPRPASWPSLSGAFEFYPSSRRALCKAPSRRLDFTVEPRGSR